jgi:hypothetical protein
MFETRPWIGALVTVLAVTCACSTAPKTASPATPVGAVHINPANIRRVAGDLPPGYEVAKVAGISAPPRVWGLGAASTAHPPQCAALADPARGRGESAQGVSGSGTGGIVDAVVVALSSGPAALDPNVVSDCKQWTMSTGRATASIHLIDPPGIGGVQTLGMAIDTTTSVEGGVEIVSHAYTFTAYLGAYYAFTTLITDPGSAHPPLTPQFAADLLVKTVSALRG